MLNTVKHDYQVLSKKTPRLAGVLFEVLRDAGFRAVVLYRMGRWCRRHRLGPVAAILERLMHHLSHCWISTLAEIGPGLRIPHVCGIVIPPGVVIGRHCEIRQNVTLGGNYGKKSDEGRTNPRVGDHVSIGPGAVILGPVEIGDGTIIGANAVVTTDIPPNSVVGAFRAEVLAARAADGSFVRPDPPIALSRKAISDKLRALEARIGCDPEQNEREFGPDTAD